MSDAIYKATAVGFALGFIGDLSLNYLTQEAKVLDAGLINYFPTHRTVEAGFIAGGLVSFFSD